jgi:hypothetical protein
MGHEFRHQSPIEIADIRVAKIDVVFQCLKKIPQYTTLDNVDLRQVDVMSIIPLARHIVKERLAFSTNLLSAMLKAGIEPYRPFFLRHSADQWRLIMPPVLEKHSSELVIFDGLHRFWLARQEGIICPWALCIDRSPLPLPSTPRDWNQVIVTETQYSVAENLLNVDESLVRPLSRMFRSSLTLYSQLDVES